MTAGAARGGQLQRRVRATIAQVGGYWRPLAAAVRLLEELGELDELLDEPAREPSEHASELADLWIITTALADQFLAEVADPGLDPDPASGPDPAPGPDLGPDSASGPGAAVHAGVGGPGEQPARALGDLLAAAGQIARVVNYYDGPKTPRAAHELPTLAGAVARFHRALATHARAHRIDLAAAVERKLAAIGARDAGRFAPASADPSTAACLAALRERASEQLGLEPARARLWGAAPAPASSPEDSARELAPTLSSFARAARRERLQGYVVAGPARSPAEDGSAWARRLLVALCEIDELTHGHAAGASAVGGAGAAAGASAAASASAAAGAVGGAGAAAGASAAADAGAVAAGRPLSFAGLEMATKLLAADDGGGAPTTFLLLTPLGEGEGEDSPHARDGSASRAGGPRR
ncbi:MAG TPA: hypothetical protein VKV16_08580 [Solirubrobacteraceae bacterium]|nr:hypothetical protein [Solirubrobacteraceae bacterium]